MPTVKIKGTFQLNGPKTINRELVCSQSEVGYYTQLMRDKSQQEAWILANYPGAKTSRGFSMSVNIK